LTENTVEGYLRKKVGAVRGKCYKFVCPGHVGAPDRICIFPGGRIYFVETKAPGGKPRPTQLMFHRELAELGVTVRVIDTQEKVREFVKEVTASDI
jgi:hypothetical protein